MPNMFKKYNHSIMLQKAIFLLGLVVSCRLAIAQPQTINTAPPRKLTHAEEVMLKAKTGKPFDVRRICLRGDNLYSYKGQELYVFPYKPITYYEHFKDPSVTGSNPDYYGNMHYHNNEMFEGTGTAYSGTAAKFLVGRTFIVDRISQSSDDADDFIFEMHDKKTSERVSYEYSIATDWHRKPNYNPANPDFPFLVNSHYNYLKKKYIGKQLVVACRKYYESKEYAHHLYIRKDNGEFEDVNLEIDYSIFNVKDIIWDENGGMLCFELRDSNGKQYFSPVEATYNEPEYTLGVGKKFLLSDWNACIAKYGQEEMNNVMRSDIHIGMDSALVRLSVGNPYINRFAKKSDGWEWLYSSKDVMVVFDDNGKVKDIVEGVPSKEGDEAVAMLVVGAGALSFGAMAWRFISFPFRLIGRLFAFLGL